MAKGQGVHAHILHAHVILMEVNPHPARANDGKLAFMAGFAGVSYPKMRSSIQRLIGLGGDPTVGSLARILLHFCHWPSFAYKDL
jgi:hypothetical protein